MATTTPVEIPISIRGLKQVKKELKEMKSQLATATDPAEIERLSEAVTDLNKEFVYANQQMEVMGTTDPFKQGKMSIALMSEQLMNLDFKGATNSANLFATSIQNMDKKDISKTIGKYTTAVFKLGGAFVKVGMALLANPIFLIAAVIATVVTAVVLLMSKFGLLKPILKAVGKVFEFIKHVIHAVVQAIKDFLDYMGLTSFAQEDAAKRQVAALEKVDAAREKQINKVTEQYDLQIRLAQIEGKSTFDLERKKQKYILETAKQRYHATIEQLKLMALTGEADEEEIKRLREKAAELKKTAQNARNELKVIDAQEKADNKKKNEELEKQDKESYKKRIEDAKAYAAERLAIQRQIRDLEISLLGEGEIAESIALSEKYFRLQQDIAKNEKLTSNERKRLLELYAQEEAQAIKEIREKYKVVEEEQGLLPLPEDLESEIDTLVEIMDEKFGARELFAGLKRNFTENFKESFDGTLGAADSMFKGMSALSEAFAGSSEKSAKKAFGIQKAANIAQATMDTYKGAVGAFTQAVSTYPAPLGSIIGGIQAASVVAMGIANIKKISSQQFGDKSGGVSATTGGGATSTTPATPSVNLFGQNNDLNNLSSAQSNESTQNITVQAVVSETELTATQNKIKKITQNAVL